MTSKRPRLSKFWDLLYPERCPGCGVYLEAGKDLCPSCKARVAFNESPHCPCCGVSEKDCRCRKNDRAYDRIVAPFFYEGPVREAVLSLKFGKREENARFLGYALAEAVDARYFGESFDVITAVPLTGEKLSERGYNQARSIGTFLMQKLPEPLVHAEPDWNLLKKKGTDSAQHFLGAEARRKNIRNSLRVSSGRTLAGKRILLVDDIVTTGATVEECAAILKLNGATRVCVAAAAVTRNTGAQYEKTKENFA